jgi:hypothetical protein
MAVIFGPPPPLETLILSLLPPPFLPLRDEEHGRTSVLPVELANWQQLLARTISQVNTTLDQDETGQDGGQKDEDVTESRRRLAEGVARWDLAEAEDEDGGGEGMMDGWVVQDLATRRDIRGERSCLINKGTELYSLSLY